MKTSLLFVSICLSNAFYSQDQPEGGCGGYHIDIKSAEYNSDLTYNKFESIVLGSGYVVQGNGTQALFEEDYWAYQDFYIREGQEIEIRYYNCLHQYNQFPTNKIQIHFTAGKPKQMDYFNRR